MALEISYWTGTDAVTRKIYGHLISAESMTLTGASSQSGVVPQGAALARVSAGEACRVNTGPNPTAASSTAAFLAAGTFIDIEVKAGDKIAGITA